MSLYEKTFMDLAKELFENDNLEKLEEIFYSKQINSEKVISFDKSLGGPSMLGQSREGSSRYFIEDRDIFRPIQYCRSHFQYYLNEKDGEWIARDIVEMSSMHIEELVKRIGKLWKLPLGQAIGTAVVKAKLDAITWKQIKSYVGVYNDAKHNFSQEKDTHLFSINDALISYFICRKLAEKLYPLADLATDPKIFET